MPLVSGTIWFPSDSGDALPVVPRRRPPDRGGDPTPATLIPGPLPSGALSWHLEQRSRSQARPWQPSAESPSGAWPTLESVPQAMAWYRPPEARQVRRLFRPVPEPPGLLSTPPDAPVLAWQPGQEILRRRPAVRLAGSTRLLWIDALTPTPPAPPAPTVDQLLAWLQAPETPRPRPFVLRLDGQAVWIPRLPDPPGLGWQASVEVLRSSPRPRQRDETPIVPLWTWGIGQPVPALSWQVTGEQLLRSRPWRLTVPPVHVPLLGVSDVPLTVLLPALVAGHVLRSSPRPVQRHHDAGVLWTVDTRALPWISPEQTWARRVWRPPVADGSAPLAPPGNDQPTLIGWQTLPEVLRQSPGCVRATEAATLAAPVWLVEPPHWTVVLTSGEVLRRPRTRGRIEEATPSSLLWEAAAVALDRLGQAWIATPEALRRVRREVIREDAPLVLGGPLTMAMPWVPVQGGDWRFVRRPWAPPAPDAWAAWIAAGLVVVSGPYYAVRAAVYTAGAVEGDARSVQ